MVTTETGTRKLSYIQAVNEALRQEMERDPAVFIMGEDIAGGAGREDQGIIDSWGGPMRLTKGLIKQFGKERVRDTPISEAGFIGAGVGAAATGLRPVVELMYVSFFGVCSDQITNNAAKMHYMFGGKIKLPLTIMTGMGAGLATAAQHSETLYSIFTHFPGLKCAVPSDAFTGKGIMTTSIRDDDPVIIFQNRQLMGLPASTHVPEDPYTLPIGKARITREGSDVTLVGIGFTSYLNNQAADLLAAEGISADVVDLLWTSPLDEEAILDSVQKTRKVVIVDEDYPRCSLATDISALVAEQGFDYLDAPPKRVSPPHTSVPYSQPLEAAYMPTAEKVVEAVREVMA